MSIPTHKATGTDGLGAKLLKIAAPAISRLINNCIDASCFPSMWKQAKVTPIFKGKGSRDEVSNYRPISVLPILSKVFEKHIAKSLRTHLDANGLLYRLQSGFRKSFSTETALIRLLDQLMFDLDDNRVSGLVFVDYKKAFDLIDHLILINKLYTYGIKSKELHLFRSYLAGRTQYVNISGVTSPTRTIELGVPQGSILGPILFLIFINDLPCQLQHSVVDIYADDTTLSHSAQLPSAPQSISEELQKDVDNITTWSRTNNMILNESKTKTMLITGKRLGKKLDSSCLDLKMNNRNLEQVSSFKLLGVTIDSELSFDSHVDSLCTKLSQRIAILRKIRRFLPLKERILYYNAMIKQLMLYGSTIWCTTANDNLKRVFKLQKRAARVILESDSLARTVNLFHRLKWIPFYDEAKICKASLVHKRLNGNCPDYMIELLRKNADIHISSRNSRYGNLNLICPKYKRECEGGRTFSVSAIKLWNQLPKALREKETETSFRNALNLYFRNSYKDLDHFHF